MYFDLEPKSKREDLYDFKEPLGRLLDLPRGQRARVEKPKAFQATGKPELENSEDIFGKLSSFPESLVLTTFSVFD